MVTAITVETTPTMSAVTFDDFATPTTEHDCAVFELETVRYGDTGIDEDGTIGRY